MDAPLEYAVLHVEVGLGCLLLKEDVLHEDVQQVELRLGFAEGAVPEHGPACRKDAHVVKHNLKVIIIVIKVEALYVKYN